MGLRVVSAAVLAALLIPGGSALADPGPALSVDAGAGRHAISPLIYGWNFADKAFGAEIELPVDRRGGNSADVINWQTGVENHSNDFFFENLPTCWPDCPVGWDPAHSYTDQIDGDHTIGAKTIIDLPMLGRVPTHFADELTTVHCSYSIAKYGAQDRHDQYATDCGDGMQGGNPVNNDPNDTGTAVSASFQGSWVDDLVNRYQSAANGGVAFYELGNEPGLWNSTHRDWHPAPVDANELLTKSEQLATQVKQHDPSAQTIGPAEWGWPNYFCSAADGGCGPDGAPGGVPLMQSYLSHFKDLEQANGTRLLDYLDVHYYAQGGNTPDITRSLWDPAYHDPSWVNDVGNSPIRLIPRMHEWVANGYPGTKISLSEYDLANGGNPTTNNVIEADVLGIFAREQMDMATLWPETSNDNYYDAFRVYRNYDGAHGKFGDTYVASASANQSQLSVYGATRSADGALTVVVVNKSGTELTSSLSLANFTPGSAAQLWRWTTPGGGIARQGDVSTCGGAVNATYPASSITMLVVAAGDGSGCATPAGGAPGGGTPGGSTPLPTGTTTTKRCVVPKLRGLTIRKAKRKLKQAHCRLGKVRKAHSKRRRGTIIRQKPKPRKRLKAGSRVAVVVSRGR